MMMKRLKKLPVWQWAALALVLSFTLVIGACSNGQISEGQGDNRLTPIADDFTITGLSSIYDGSAKSVGINPKDGKSQGTITIHYEGTDGTAFTKSTTGPSAIGSYDVTFDVAATSEWKQASGLSAGTLKIDIQTIFAIDPVVDDFEITGLSQEHDGSVKSVSITQKDEKSDGQITIYYEGTDGTDYPKTTAKPSAVGAYAVTFDIAAAIGWKEAIGLEAGILTIRGTPVADDYEIDSDSLNQLSNNIKAVEITVKEGKSPGTITIYYNNSTDLPTTEGTYAVTFNVAASGLWNEANGLAAGNLIIGDPAKETPTAEDYTVSVNLNQTAGHVTPVTVVAIGGKSSGKVTVYYAGAEGTSYDRTTDLPTEPGEYTVTFDVAGTNTYNPASALHAGTLIIKGTPVLDDFYIDNLEQTAGSVLPVTVNVKGETKSSGEVTVYYNNSTVLPSAPGQYTVTFDVAAVEPVWNAAHGLTVETPLIIWGIPSADDYTVSANLNQVVGSVTAVTVTAKSGKSSGAVTVKYNGAITLPQTVGEYAVTFDVAGSGFWKAAIGLEAGTLTITAYVEPAKNYISGPDALSWGVESQASVLTLGLTPGNTTKDIRLTWYASGSTTTGKVAHVRFVKGTFTAGTNLKEVTTGGTVAANATYGGTYTYHKVAVTDYFEPGASYQYSVSSNGTAWSKVYDYKVPAANSFKFGVVADPQINATSWDANNRYTPNVSTGKAAASWKDTMDYISTKGISLLLMNGDLVDTWGGAETEYTSLFAPEGLRSIPVGPVMGNHDGNIVYGGTSAGSTGNMFFYHFNIPNEKGTANSNNKGANYYYLYNNVLIVALNTMSYPNSKTDAATYIPIFRNTIEAAKAAFPKDGDAQGNNKWDWLIIQHHKSTASVGDHCADVEIQYFVEAGFETLMSEVGADFVIAGHDHVYARSYPLRGMGDGKVSVPDKSNGESRTYTNPGQPIYLTIGPSSGLKYFAVNVDPYFKYNNTLDKKDNASYPYFGTDSGGTATLFGSQAYLSGNLPVSNAAFQQPYIPSYTIVEVNGRTIKFSTYPVYTISGQNSGASLPYNFDRDVPYDWVEVTK